MLLYHLGHLELLHVGSMGAAVLFARGADLLAHTPAEFGEAHEPAAVKIKIPELGLRLARREPEPELLQTLDKLLHVDLLVILGDVGEHLMKLAEPEDVEQQRVKFLLFDLVVAVNGVLDRLLVGPFERGVVTQPARPRAALDEVRDQRFDLREIHDVVPVLIELLPQYLAAFHICDLQLPHLPLQRHAHVHERVVRDGRLIATQQGILVPLPAIVAPRPRPTAQRRRWAPVVRDEGVAGRAVVQLLADHPPRLPGVKDIARIRASARPIRELTVHACRLVIAIDQRILPDAATNEEPLVAPCAWAPNARPGARSRADARAHGALGAGLGGPCAMRPMHSADCE
mmetsp:Transcript_87116/g.251593  ORF Transcript_87116/g.251593 Transcript_87116/m.251593 type:complete len:344 (-) Transcript_87116:49-1080(-)